MLETGLARILSGEVTALAKKRIGLIVNPTAVDGELRHIVDLLHGRADLVCLFGPEHGVRGEAQDMIGVADARDTLGTPIRSLYGPTFDDVLALKSMHQRYTNYLRWLRWKT